MKSSKVIVLILLLVEYPFGLSNFPMNQYKFLKVLILLLVEYPFGHLLVENWCNKIRISLNPSFSGISFRTLPELKDKNKAIEMS